MQSRLREWRVAQGPTLDEIGALTGYSAATISRIETGKREPRPLAKVRFARSLQVLLRDLFECAERKPEKAL